MALSNDIILEFAKLANSNKNEQKETVVYGTIVISDGKKYVRLDGSNIDTPVSSTTSGKNGDRVMVTIKNHEAIVTGNITSPSTSQDALDEVEQNVEGRIDAFDEIVANKVDTDYLETNYLKAEEIRADYIKAEEIEADYVKTSELEADYIKAKDIEAEYVKTSTLEADYITADKIETDYASVGKLEAVNAEIRNIKADYVTTEKLEADYINAEEIEADYVKTETLEADYVKTETLEADYVKTDTLEAGYVKTETLETEYIKADDMDVKYANIDFANIGEAALNKIYADSGIIKDIKIQNGIVTGELVGVTIKGDLIEGNTIKADKLVVKGNDGLYYKLNFESGNFAGGEEVPTDGLHGSVIIANTITAEQINVSDLVAFDATIGGFKIGEHSLYSGVKESVHNTTRGTYLDDTGQFALGDGGNYIKYYKDSNGNWKLAMAVESLSIGINSTKVEDIAKDAEDAANKVTELEERMDSGEFKGEDAVLLRIESSRGTVFKNDSVSTILSVVIYRGPERITNSAGLTAAFGSSAYLQWKWQRLDDETFGVISSSDKRFGDNGFTFTLSPEDVDTKITFMCELII